MDCRFHLKAKFNIYGEDYEWACSLNWSDRGDGIDYRIHEWFQDCHDKAYAKWQAELYERQADERAVNQKAHELAELARLKLKYPNSASE